MVENKVSQSTERSNLWFFQKDKKVERDMERVFQIIVYLYYLYLDREDNVSHVFWTNKGSGKNKSKPANNLK